jgi:hypothetical protein
VLAGLQLTTATGFFYFTANSMKRKTKWQRGDVAPWAQAPKDVQKFLLKLAGYNPHSEPMLRLCLADGILSFRGGKWHDWPEYAKLEEQGGMQFSDETMVKEVVLNGALGKQFKATVEMPREMIVNPQKPMRVVREMRWIQRYPNKRGWMLQMWEPPSRYGDRTWWENQRVAGAEDLMILGPFPDNGAYEPFLSWIGMDQKGKPFCEPTWPEIPSLARLELGYNMMMRNRETAQSANKDWRILSRVIEVKNQQDAQERRDHEENVARIRDHIKPFLATTLGANRLRTELEKRSLERSMEAVR